MVTRAYQTKKTTFLTDLLSCSLSIKNCKQKFLNKINWLALTLWTFLYFQTDVHRLHVLLCSPFYYANGFCIVVSKNLSTSFNISVHFFKKRFSHFLEFITCYISLIISKVSQSRKQRIIRRESKTDSYSKDLLFLACVAFCVITFEPIMI